jgi:hypothetical protein
MAEPGPIRLDVVGVDGRVIRSWTDHLSSPGHVRVTWDGRTRNGSLVAAGRYYLVVRGSAGRRVVNAITVVR